MNAELRKIVDGFVEIGWTEERKDHHVIVWAPGGTERLTLSTGSRRPDPEYYKKLKGKLRRARATKESRT